MKRIAVLLAIGVGVAATMASAQLPARATAARPVAVSPGDTAKLDLVEARCPTFSWGSVAGASSYELVIYRLGEEGEEAQPVLKHRISGSALGWTPSLDRCLERGGRYAWSVRAMGEKKASEWSAPSLFEVAPGPREAEFEDALEVVRRYLAAGGEKSAPAQVTALAETVSRPAASRPPLPVSSDGALPPTLLNVAGNANATSYTGDGSMLAGVATDAELGAHAGLPTVHHTPTVDTDTFVTGKDAHDHLGGDGAALLHSSLDSVGASDHHARYTDAEAVTAMGVVLDQENAVLDGAAGSADQWQSFTAGWSGNLSSVDLYVDSGLSGQNQAGTIRIYEGEGTAGTLLATQSVTFAHDAFGFQSFAFDALPPVSSGSLYTIRFGVPTTNVGWVSFGIGDPYPGGRSSYDPSWDILFRTYVGAHPGVPDAHREHATLEESAEIDADILAHKNLPSDHHTKTVDTDTVLSEAQVETFVTNGPLDGSQFTSLNGSNVSIGAVAETHIAEELARDDEVLALIAAERVELQGQIDASMCRPGSSRAGIWCIDDEWQGPAEGVASMAACHQEAKTVCPLEAITSCDSVNLTKIPGVSCGFATDGGFRIRTSTQHHASTAAFDFVGYNSNNILENLPDATAERYYCCRPARIPTHLRFVDMGDGTVLDNNTDLRWLKNANCDGTKNWQGAQDWAAQLADGQCGLSDGSGAGAWRVPTIAELCSAGEVAGSCPAVNAVSSLVNSTFTFPALSNAAGDGPCILGSDCAFSGVVSGWYWSSSPDAGDDERAWFTNMIDGNTWSQGLKLNTFNVWPVRGGQ